MRPAPAIANPARRLLLCAALLLGFVAASSPVSAAAAERVRPLLTGLVDRTLPNGLRVIFRPDPGNPAASLRVVVCQTGSLYEEEYTGCGLSHLVEHLVFRGAESNGDTDISARFHQLGGRINAFTDKHRTTFTLDIPAARLPEAVALLPAIVLDARFDQPTFESERTVVLRELTMAGDDPDETLIDRLWLEAYAPHPYRAPVGGWSRDLMRLRLTDVERYYRRHYTPGNLILTAAGGFDAAALSAALEKAFAPHPWRPVRPALTPPTPANDRSLDLTLPLSSLKTGRLLMAFRTCPARADEAIVLDLLAEALGTGKNSLLYRRCIEREKTADSIDVSSYSADLDGLFLIQATCSPENLPKVRRSVLETLAQVRRDGVGHDLFRLTREALLRSKYFELETTASVAGALALGASVLGDPAYLDTYLFRVKGLDAESLRSAANRYLVPAALFCIEGVPAPEPPPTPPAPAAAAQPGEPRLATLENGVRIVTRRDARLPIVSLCAVVGAGVYTEPQPGLCRLVSSLLLEGAGGKDARGQEKRIRELGGELKSFSGYHSMGLTLDVPAPALDEGLKTLVDTLRRPAFTQKSLDQERALQASELARVDEEAFQMAARLARRQFFGAHPYARLTFGEKDSLASLTPASVRGYWAGRLRGPNLVVACCGDFDEAALTALLKNALSDLPGGPAGAPQPLQRPLQRENRTGEFPVPFAQSIAVLGLDCCPLTDADFPVFQLLESFFGDAANPLYETVRSRAGDAYAVGAVGLPGLDTGGFLFYAATPRTRVGAALAAMKETVARLKTSGLSAEEMARAAEKAVGEHVLGMQSRTAVAMAMALDTLYGLGPQYWTGYERRIRAVTPADIARVCNRYFAHALELTLAGSAEEPATTSGKDSRS